MGRVVITGASGLLGSNLARNLHQLGHSVCCIKRRTSDVSHLADLPLSWSTVELSDLAALTNAFEGKEAVFHCAALVSYAEVNSAAMELINVEGTRNVIDAAIKAGVKRLIHCSTVDALPFPQGGEIGTEQGRWNWPNVGFNFSYSRTKYRAQELALSSSTRGLDTVVVNPAFMLGPSDPKPSSGRLILHVARGRAWGYPAGSNNFVDVRDVCKGMILAWERGRSGECYILGGQNITYREIFLKIAALSGVRAPKILLPKSLFLGAGYLGDILSFVGAERDITTATARLAYAQHKLSSDKAKRELGYNPGGIENAVRDALQWFRGVKYL